MAKSIIYHKSSCITCKKAISEIDRMKIDIERRDFFKEPFSESELKKIIKLSGKKAEEFLRKRDKMYKELDFENSQRSENEIVKLMVKYPGLIKRPIIIKQSKTLVGKIDSKDLK
ncbi:MAG: arsenate reductase family protein [Candidatus Nitrosomaritimum aestuariumsis]